MISVFSVARDAIFILFSVPNSLQLEYVCNVDNTEMQKYLKMLFNNPNSPVKHQIIHNIRGRDRKWIRWGKRSVSLSR